MMAPRIVRAAIAKATGTSLPIEHRRMLLRVLTLLVISLIVGGIAVWRWLWIPTGPKPEDVLSYWQLVVANGQIFVSVVTLTLVAIFGFYAIEQVLLARASLRDNQEARAHERDATELRIRQALFVELHHNWVVTLWHSGELHFTGPLEGIGRILAKRQVYDAMLVGPGWDLARNQEVWDAVRAAYWQIEVLRAVLSDRRLWAEPLATGAATFIGMPSKSPFSDKDWIQSLKGRTFYAIIAVLISMVASNPNVFFLLKMRKRTILQARAAIQTAMEKLKGEPIDWQQVPQMEAPEFAFRLDK